MRRAGLFLFYKAKIILPVLTSQGQIALAFAPKKAARLHAQRLDKAPVCDDKLIAVESEQIVA